MSSSLTAGFLSVTALHASCATAGAAASASAIALAVAVRAVVLSGMRQRNVQVTGRLIQWTALPSGGSPFRLAESAGRWVQWPARVPTMSIHRSTPPPRRGRTPSEASTGAAQVQSLTRGLSILECLARAEGGLTLTDIAHRVTLPPSTAHRLLSTLERGGYVYQAGDLGLWYVGLHAFT